MSHAEDPTRVQKILTWLQNHRLASILIVVGVGVISLAKFITSVDEIRRFTGSLFVAKGPTDVEIISGTAGDVVDVPLPHRYCLTSPIVTPHNKVEMPRQPRDSPLVITAIRSPRSADNYFYFTYDVYFQNPTGSEITITSLWYRSSLEIPHGDAFMGTVIAPNVGYKVTYKLGESERLPLSPMYVIPAHGHGAIRLYLSPNKSRGEVENLEGAVHAFYLKLYDSQDRDILLVNIPSGDNSWEGIDTKLYCSDKK